MKTELLLAEFLSTPWALMPERLNAVSAVMARWSSHAPATAAVSMSIKLPARLAVRQQLQSLVAGSQSYLCTV